MTVPNQFPENTWSRIFVRGKFIDMTGAPMTGQVQFSTNVTGRTLLDRHNRLIISSRPYQANLDGSGYFEIQLPATNDPDITPTSFTYTVLEPTGRSYPIVVPYDTPVLSLPGDPLNGQQVIDLIDIVPAPGSSGGVGQLLRGVGIQSVTNAEGGGWLVAYTDGRTDTISVPDTVKGDPGEPGSPGDPGPKGDKGDKGDPGDVSTGQLTAAVDVHNTDPAAHPDIRGLIGEGGASSLADLTDVDTTGAAVGKVLAVEQADPFSAHWVDPPTGGGASAFADLTDVDTTDAATSEILAVARDGATLTVTTRDPLTPAQVREGIPIPLGDTDAWTLYGSGSARTVTVDTDPDVGKYVRIETTAQGWTRIGRDLTRRLDGDQFVSFLLRRVDANLTTFGLYAGLGAYGIGTASTWSKSAGTLPVGEWRRHVIHPDDQTYSGTPTDFHDLRSITIQVNPATGTDTAVEIADIRVHPGRPRGGCIAFVFDDGHLDTYTEAFPRLQSRGFPAGVAVEHVTVGQASPPRCSLAQLHELYDAGWDMYGHHTAQMTSLTEAQQVGIHQASKAFLSVNGFRRGDDIWAWPGGARDATTEKIALRYWRTARMTNSFTSLGMPHVYDPLRPPLGFYATAATPVTTAMTRVDKIAEKGGSLVLVFHRLVTSGATAEDYLLSDFETLLDHVDSTGVDVVPASHIWTA